MRRLCVCVCVCVERGGELVVRYPYLGKGKWEKGMGLESKLR